MTEQKAGLRGHSYDVTVVCGVIEYGGKILIGKQVEGEHPADLGGKWHFPGGRVEEGESIEEALKRALAAGLGVRSCHSLAHSSIWVSSPPAASMARWDISESSVAPCQCFSPAGT